MTHHTAEHRSQAMNACITACTQCEAICLETINYCLDEGGEHADPDHIALMAVCADICSTCRRAMLLGSDARKTLCSACADVCRECADSCERLGDDADMKRCAEVCRRCAESCAAMT